MKGHGSKFGRKKEEAIAALLTQQTIENAARSIGIGVSTLLRWQKDPEFDAGYRAAQRAAYRQTTARLQQASPAAATVLTKLMVDSNSRHPCALAPLTACSVMRPRQSKPRTSRRVCRNWSGLWEPRSRGTLDESVTR